MSCKTNPTYETVKNQFLKGRTCVADLKAEIRKQFKNKIKTVRNTKYDERRKMSPKRFISGLLQESLHSIQSDLLRNFHSELHEQSIIDTLNEVQEELLQINLRKMMEEREKEEKENLESIINVHFVTCSICDKFMEPQCDKMVVICSECAEQHFVKDRF